MTVDKVRLSASLARLRIAASICVSSSYNKKVRNKGQTIIKFSNSVSRMSNSCFNNISIAFIQSSCKVDISTFRLRICSVLYMACIGIEENPRAKRCYKKKEREDMESVACNK